MQKETKRPHIGYITKVEIDYEFRDVRVDAVVGHNRELSNVSVFNPHRDIWNVPSEGDFIYIHFVEGKYVASLSSTFPRHRVPHNINMGDMFRTPDELTHLHFAGQKEEDSDDPEEWTDVKFASSGQLKFYFPDKTDHAKADEENELEFEENSYMTFSQEQDEDEVNMDMAMSGNLRVHLPDEVKDDSEVVEENSYFEFERQSDGTVDLNINVTGDVDVTVEEGDANVSVQEGGVEVEADDDIDVIAGQTAQIIADQILVGEDGTPVARQDHTHDYGDGGVTDTPNEDGTETLIK